MYPVIGREADLYRDDEEIMWMFIVGEDRKIAGWVNFLDDWQSGSGNNYL